MAIIEVRPISEGRAGEELEDGLKRFFRSYVVVTDSTFDGPDTVRQAEGLPKLGNSYPSHPSAVVVAVVPRQMARSRLIWRVDVEWSTHSIDRDENPLATKPEIEYSYETYEEPIAGSAKSVDVTQDQGQSSSDTAPGTHTQGTDGYYGFPILNAAGHPLPGILTSPNFYPVVRVTRNEPHFDAIKAVTYGNTVNLASWNGLRPRQAWLKPIDAMSMIQYSAGIDQPDIRYWRVRYTFVLKGQTWDRKFLNIGRWYRTSAGADDWLPFQDSAGNPTWDLLKADGTRYAKNTPVAQKKATWLVFPVLIPVDFGPLSINLNLSLNELRKRPRAS